MYDAMKATQCRKGGRISATLCLVSHIDVVFGRQDTRQCGAGYCRMKLQVHREVVVVTLRPPNSVGLGCDARFYQAGLRAEGHGQKGLTWPVSNIATASSGSRIVGESGEVPGLYNRETAEWTIISGACLMS